MSANSGERPRLLFLVNEDRYFWSHRRWIALAAMEQGYDVFVVGEVTEVRSQIEAAGIPVYGIESLRGLRDPFRELRTLWRIISLYREIRPDVVHHVTIKNIFLGTFAARVVGVPGIVNAFAGLGYLFYTNTWKAFALRTLICFLLRVTLRGANIRSIFQNDDDFGDMLRIGVVRENQSVLIRGAGVDADEFQPARNRTTAGPLTVVLATRLLWSKGLAEFVSAARQVKARGMNVRFVAVGRLDPHNMDHVSAEQVEAWMSEGAIEWWGHRTDMPDVLALADVVCLPAIHGEGFPKALLEAAAVACPIVASDVRGCREICRHEINGLLVPPGDAQALAEALTRLLEDASLRRRMGEAGRAIVLNEFTAQEIARQTLEVYGDLIDPVRMPDDSTRARSGDRSVFTERRAA